jgi:hypothetical protein
MQRNEVTVQFFQLFIFCRSSAVLVYTNGQLLKLIGLSKVPHLEWVRSIGNFLLSLAYTLQNPSANGEGGPEHKYIR